MINTDEAPITISRQLEGGVVETIFRFPGYPMSIQIRELRWP